MYMLHQKYYTLNTAGGPKVPNFTNNFTQLDAMFLVQFCTAKKYHCGKQY